MAFTVSVPELGFSKAGNPPLGIEAAAVYHTSLRPCGPRAVQQAGHLKALQLLLRFCPFARLGRHAWVLELS